MPQPISRVKDSHPSWCLERTIRSFKELQWIHKLQVQATTSRGHIKFILFFLSSQVFSPYFSSMEWGALGEIFIYLREILLLNYFVFWCKLYLFQVHKYLRSKFQDISCIIVQYWKNSAISPIPCCKLLQSWWNRIYVWNIDDLWMNEMSLMYNMGFMFSNWEFLAIESNFISFGPNYISFPQGSKTSFFMSDWRKW